MKRRQPSQRRPDQEHGTVPCHEGRMAENATVQFIRWDIHDNR
jgi:hypothetical protein